MSQRTSSSFDHLLLSPYSVPHPRPNQHTCRRDRKASNPKTSLHVILPHTPGYCPHQTHPYKQHVQSQDCPLIRPLDDMNSPPCGLPSDMRAFPPLMDTVVKFLGEQVQPCAARMGTGRVEVVEEDVCGNWRWFLERTGAGAILPGARLDVLVRREGEWGLKNADVTVFETELYFIISYRDIKLRAKGGRDKRTRTKCTSVGLSSDHLWVRRKPRHSWYRFLISSKSCPSLVIKVVGVVI